MEDFGFGILAGLGIGFLLIGIVISVFTMPNVAEDHAEFLCDSHGKEFIDFKNNGWDLTQVTCGPPKSTNLPEGYEVFENGLVER